MAEPNTPGEARKHGLRKSRWVAAGAAVGAAAFLTGIIAGVNGADDNSLQPPQISSTNGDSQYTPRSDDGSATRFDDDDDYDDDYDDDDEDDRPFTPQQPSGSASGSSGSTQQSPSFTPQPQTRSGGS